jgi:hypothetical protein
VRGRCASNSTLSDAAATGAAVTGAAPGSNTHHPVALPPPAPPHIVRQVAFFPAGDAMSEAHDLGDLDEGCRPTTIWTARSSTFMSPRRSWDSIVEPARQRCDRVTLYLTRDHQSAIHKDLDSADPCFRGWEAT